MPVGSYNHPLFGLVRFRVDAWTRGAEIREFLSGFDTNDVDFVEVPQLHGVPGTNGGRMKFHKRAHAQVLQAFADLELQGLMPFVHSSAGSFYPRLRKPAGGGISRKPSEHSFGIAIDINSDELPVGTTDNGDQPGTVRPLRNTFEGLGFVWGNSFSDPMHFEVRTFIDDPKTTVKKATVVRGGIALNIRAYVLQGHVYVSARDFQEALGGTLDGIVIDPPSLAFANPQGVSKRFSGKMIGNSMFVMLTLVSGHFGFTMAWDNGTRTAALS